jgi:hypothetical protein
MKKPILILAAFAALSLASCGNSENKTEHAAADTTTAAVVEETKAEPEAAASIVGTWKLTDVDLGMVAPKGQEKTFDDLKKEMIAKTVYTFGEDGTISLTSPMAKSAGTYTLEGDKLTTVINKKTESVIVQSMTASELVLTIEERGTKMVMKFQK